MTARDEARANMIALAAEAPDALPGARLLLNHPRRHPESSHGRLAGADILALANDAPGALPGSLACICPEDYDRALVDFQHDCPQHGDRLDYYLYLAGVQRKRMTSRLYRPHGMGRA